MDRVTACDVPEGSLLALFGGPEDYRDCFCREVPGAVDLSTFIERFYCSMAFLPERMVLGAMGRGASSADARPLARGGFGVWEVVERRESQILLESRGTGTASWLSVEPLGGSGQPPSRSQAAGQTRLLFGSWVGGVGQSAWRFMQRPHHIYARVADIVLRRQHQHLEHRHRVIGRTSALRSVRITQRLHQRRPERLEIHNSGQNLKRVAMRRKPLQMIR